MRILIINGPNLDLLGTREPHIYGYDTVDDIVARVQDRAKARGATIIAFQSNHEGALIDFLQGHAASEGAIINPGGLAHTSIVLRDAVSACAFPVVEVHISDVTKREPFRHHSYLKDVTANQIIGMGVVGYEVALRWLIERNGKK